MKAATMLLLALALSACSESPQQSAGKDRTPAWQGADDPYVVSGWKRGDKTSWEDQLQARAQAQNEYRRIGTSH